jgi:hypothetical protein
LISLLLASARVRPCFFLWGFFFCGSIGRRFSSQDVDSQTHQYSSIRLAIFNNRLHKYVCYLPLQPPSNRFFIQFHARCSNMLEIFKRWAQLLGERGAVAAA